MDHVQPSPEWQMFTVTVYLTTHFLPSMEGFAVFCTESILSYSSSGKAWYLKDTAKQTRNMHRATTKRTHTKYKVLDMLALRTSYKSNTCTVKNYIFFLLSHSKTPNYWALVKIYNAWAVMQDHIQLFRIQTSSQLPEVRNSFKNLQHMSKPQRPGQLTQDHPFYLSCDWEEFKQNYNKIIKTSFCSILITAVTYYFVVLGNYFNKTPSNCQRSQRMASLQWHLFFSASTFVHLWAAA